MAVAPPYTADENDANVAWTSQTAIAMPSPYNQAFGNPVAIAALPTLANMTKIGIATTNTERDYYFRFANTF